MKLCENMHRINYLIGEINGAYHQMSVRLDLSDSCMQVLYTLCDSGDVCPLSSVYKITGLPKQTVNSALRRLEREEILFLRQRSGREKDLVLTDKGRELARRTVFRLFQMENDIFSAWSPEDVQAYIRLTERYARDFKRMADAFPDKPSGAGEGEGQQ